VQRLLHRALFAPAVDKTTMLEMCNSLLELCLPASWFIEVNTSMCVSMACDLRGQKKWWWEEGGGWQPPGPPMPGSATAK